MSSVVQESIETILEKTRAIAKSETLIGEPIKFEGVLVVPVIKVSIGFGAGGGEGVVDEKSKGTGKGGGAGGGIRIEPSCFLVHDGTTVRVLPAVPSKGKGMDALIEKLPDLLTYAMDTFRKRRGNTEKPDETNDVEE
ncbi:MAG: spore germination protein GerW family protein [Candidatus Electryonea clarkiae]|nr:spore germination protein GerW family protein [Candidatus Electryonea clarkiae]MDP8285727.1 spore germination protein GerW family protein [Candidatus Electryonea clarkiae]